MSAKQKWLVKRNGRISGPFSTDEILEAISLGQFNGGETIARFPTQDWFAISQAPEFYDKLLDVLSSEGQPQTKGKNQDEPHNVSQHKNHIDEEEKGLAQRVFDEPTKQSTEPEVQQTVKSLSVKKETMTGTPTIGSQKTISELHEEKNREFHELGARKPKSKKGDSSVIELNDLEKKFKKAKSRQSLAPFLVISGIVVAALGYILFAPNESATERVHLVRPTQERDPLGEKEFVARFQEAISEFQKDNFTAYAQAQNRFVDLAERSPLQNKRTYQAKALGYLCMVYYEMWEYSFQDSLDHQAIEVVSAQANKLDPTGNDGVTCKIVNLMVKEKRREARSVTENHINNLRELSPQAAWFYHLRAEFELTEKSYDNAIDSLQKAQKLWPTWLKLLVQEASLHRIKSNLSTAVNILSDVINANPNHRRAMIEWGIIEENAKNFERAKQLLLAGLQEQYLPSLQKPVAYLALARIFENEGENKKAAEFAQRCYELNSGNVDCRRIALRLGGDKELRSTHCASEHIGDQFFRSGDYLAAQAEFKTAFDCNNKNASAAMKAGRSLWMLNQSTEAIKWLNKALTADPRLVEAYVTLADYQAQRYDYVEANRTLTRGLSVDPQNHKLMAGVALVELRRGAYKSAIQYGKRAQAKFETDVQTNVILAKAYMGVGDYEQAFAAIKRATDVDNSDVDAQITYAKIIFAVRGADAALYHLDMLIKTFPYLVEYRLARGEVNINEGRYNDAERDFLQVVELDSKNKTAFVELGKITAKKEQHDDAIDFFLKAAALDPSDALPVFLIGLYYLDHNMPREAFKQFESVIRINDKYPLAHFNMGKAALQLRSYERALKEAEIEMALNPQRADSYLLAAEIHLATGNYGRCAQEIQRALKLRDQGADIYVRAAQCYRLTGNLDVALRMLTIAQERESGNPLIYRELGSVQEMRGDTEAAIFNYEKYVLLAPNAPDKREYVDKARNLAGR